MQPIYLELYRKRDELVVLARLVLLRCGQIPALHFGIDCNGHPDYVDRQQFV